MMVFRQRVLSNGSRRCGRGGIDLPTLAPRGNAKHTLNVSTPGAVFRQLKEAKKRFREAIDTLISGDASAEKVLSLIHI